MSKDFSNNTLWLPTKTSKLSSLESSVYLNNLNLNLQTNSLNTKLPYYKVGNLYQSNFRNLNFFENSRFWVFKKYFFTNQQLSNTVVEYNKPLTINNLPNNSLLPYTNAGLNLSYSSIKIAQHINNNFSPSLMSNTGSTRPALVTAQDVTNVHGVNLNLSNLDVISGLNINFLYTLTSNPQDKTTNLTYFSSSINTGKTINVVTDGITFKNS